VLWLLALGLLIGLLEWPYKALSELGFALQRALWPRTELATLQDTLPWHGVAMVFAATIACFDLTWEPLAAGCGGGVAPVIALDRSAAALEQTRERQSSGRSACAHGLLSKPTTHTTATTQAA